jgi:hypothetical protein
MIGERKHVKEAMLTASYFVRSATVARDTCWISGLCLWSLVHPCGLDDLLEVVHDNVKMPSVVVVNSAGHARCVRGGRDRSLM